MAVALICISHTPLLFEEDLANADICRVVKQSFDRAASFVEAFDPELIVQFSPDHFHGFHYDNMPSFCVGADARSVGDWKTKAGPLPVDENLAIEVVLAARDADIDVAVSYDMEVDHGFVQVWEEMFGRFDKYPMVPIFINSIAYPLPKYRRARLLGEAVGRFIKQSGKRVLFAASGGLSHDPAVPKIQGATPEVRERLIGRTKIAPEQQKKREAAVRDVARQAIEMKGPALPLNPQWDHDIMKFLRNGEWGMIDSLTPESVAKVAGFGGNEVLCWVAAFAAMQACTPFEVVQEDYIEVPGWIAGLAHMSAKEVAS